MEQPLHFPQIPLRSSPYRSRPPRDLEAPFPISIQVRSNTERRFRRYWIKGLTLGCTRNYKVVRTPLKVDSSGVFLRRGG